MSRDEIDEGTVATTEPDATQTPDASQTGGSAEPDATQAPDATKTDGSAAPPEKQADSAPTGPSAEEIQAALDAFEKVVEGDNGLDEAGKPTGGAVSARDSATGEVPSAEIDKVKAAYAALQVTPARTKAKKYLDERMRVALAKLRDPGLARAYLTLADEVKSATRPDTISKPPVDPTDAHVARVTAMYLATSLVPTPDGVEDTWVQKVNDKAQALRGEASTYKEWMTAHDTWASQPEESRGDEPAEPAVDEIVKQAARLARGRGGERYRRGPAKPRTEGATRSGSASSGAGYSGPRRNVKAHILSAFDGKAVGTFLKISEIAGINSAEYGEDHPSSGAVSAALFPASGKVPSGLDGLQPAVENGVKGARKVA